MLSAAHEFAPTKDTSNSNVDLLLFSVQQWVSILIAVYGAALLAFSRKEDTRICPYFSVVTNVAPEYQRYSAGWLITAPLAGLLCC